LTVHRIALEQPPEMQFKEIMRVQVPSEAYRVYVSRGHFVYLATDSYLPDGAEVFEEVRAYFG
jgi:hypothetical protein